MIDRERIAELAKAYVCPLNLNPSTPYELGAVKQYTTFALMVIEELGYTRQSEELDPQAERYSWLIEHGWKPPESEPDWAVARHLNLKDKPEPNPTSLDELKVPPAEPKIRCQDCEYHHCYSGADGQDCSCGLSTLVTPTTNIPPPNCPLLHPAEPAEERVEAVAEKIYNALGNPHLTWGTCHVREQYRELAREILKLCRLEEKGV